jgi:hypothetical protein
MKLRQENAVLITPEMAAEFLRRNENNRSLKPFKLQAYMADMRDGRWRFNGDAIRFYADGTLADGQHRLEACVRTGIPFIANIVYGLTREDGMTLDTGVVRNNSDFLELHQHVKKGDAGHVAGAANIVISHDLGSSNYPNSGGNYTKHTTSQKVLEWYVKNRGAVSESVNWLHSEAPSRARVLSAAQIIAFRILSSRVDPDVSHAFLKKIISGFGLEEGTTEAHCRTILLNAIATPKKMTPRVRFFTAAKCFKSISAGRGIKYQTNAGFRDGLDNVPTFPGFGGAK